MTQPKEMTPKAMNWLTRIGAIQDKVARLNEQLVLDVDHAREEGASWRMIGVALGVSTQAAWERFRPPEPPRPSPGQGGLFTYEGGYLDLSPDGS